jgi:hypothetical protein
LQPLGIHVALAAWIDQNRAYEGFAAVPANPVPLAPSSLLPLSQSLDEHRQAEVVRMANLVPKKGTVAEPFGPGAALWDLVSDVIDRMVFARRALTDSEAESLQRARSVLYVDDGTGSLSSRFNAYLLMRSVVQTLQDTGAATEVQQAALSDWLTLGFKNEIEQALADVIRLAAKSSVVEAMSCRAQLDESMLLSAGDITYAPTSFYPMSAASVGTWAVAEVSLAELSTCAARTFPSSTVTFSSASAAKCRFAFASIETLRPWPFAQLLSRDDWKLSAGEPASLGDGIRGTVPAYVQTLYAASVIGVSATPSSSTHLPTGALDLPIRRGKPPILAPIARRAEKRGDVLLSGGIREGVIAGRIGEREQVRTVTLGRPRDLTLVRKFQIPLDRSEWLNRLTIIQRGRIVLHEEESAGGPAVDLASGAHVVGFGCVVVPPSPQPNEQYQW